jgi:adenine-specific DNA methylase
LEIDREIQEVFNFYQQLKDREFDESTTTFDEIAILNTSKMERMFTHWNLGRRPSKERAEKTFKEMRNACAFWNRHRTTPLDQLEAFEPYMLRKIQHVAMGLKRNLTTAQVQVVQAQLDNVMGW